MNFRVKIIDFSDSLIDIPSKDTMNFEKVLLAIRDQLEEVSYILDKLTSLIDVHDNNKISFQDNPMMRELITKSEYLIKDAINAVRKARISSEDSNELKSVLRRENILRREFVS